MWTSPVIRDATYDERNYHCGCNGKGPRPASGIAPVHFALHVAEAQKIDPVTGIHGPIVSRYLCTNAMAEMVHRLNIYHRVCNPKGLTSCAVLSESQMLAPLQTSSDSSTIPISSAP